MKVKSGWEGLIVALGMFVTAMAVIGTLKLLVG
jgi:hypothetical protein